MTFPGTLLSARRLRPRKKWGQHFLSDPSCAEMIISRSQITGEDTVLEIGAGLGALTIPACKAAKKVCAVEKDPALIELLKLEIEAQVIDQSHIR